MSDANTHAHTLRTQQKTSMHKIVSGRMVTKKVLVILFLLLNDNPDRGLFMMENFKADEPCVSCGEERDGYVCYHHIHTQKAHPEERIAPWNLIPTCAKCHIPLFHTKGMMWMSEKKPAVKEWLIKNGWYILHLGRTKWVHDPDIREESANES